MASAAIQPLVSTTTEIIKDVKGFSRKHRARYFEYARERDRLLDKITQTRADRELNGDEEQAFLENRERCENLNSPNRTLNDETTSLEREPGSEIISILLKIMPAFRG